MCIRDRVKPIFDIRLDYALFVKINSNVPMYADEFIFAKSELISQDVYKRQCR